MIYIKIPPVNCFRIDIAFDTQSLYWNVPYTKAHHDFKQRTDEELEQDVEFNRRICE